MKNRKLHNFGLNRDLFFETKFLFTDPVPTPDKPPEQAAIPENEEVGTKAKDAAEAARRKILEEGKVGAKTKTELNLNKFKKQEKLPDVATQPPVTPVKPAEEVSEFKVVMVELPNAASDKEVSTFVARDFTKQASEIDRVSVNVNREHFKPNEETWDHTTHEGLQKIYQDCKNLGIIDQDKKYYDTMFAILDGATKEKNPYWGENGGAYQAMFKFPSDTDRTTISSLEKKGSFAGGAAFLQAFDGLLYLKGNLLGSQYKSELATLDKQRKANEDPIGTKVTDFVKSNVATLQKAVRERDYATAGVYALGLYALWQTAGKKLFGDGHGHGGGDAHHGGFDFKKWAMIGAAVYGADKLLKNAGYDVLKLAGFKSMDAELRGTPMESMKNILSLPQYNEEFKDLDGGIALTMSETQLSTLEEQLNLTNKAGGVHFIDPNKFPGLFPDLRYIDTSKLGIGEQRLGDTTGMSNTKLKPSEREYIRVGQQIYKMARAMHVVYDETIHKKQKKYMGLTYEQALNDPIFGKAKVRFLMEGAGQYTLISPDEGFFSTQKRDKIEAKLLQGTNKVLEHGGFSLGNELKDGSGHFAGKFKGFPIVAVATNQGYALYLRNVYGPSYNPVPGTNYTLIPASGGGMERAAKKFEKIVDDRVTELIKPLMGIGGKNLKGLKYTGGEWQCDVTLPGATEYDIDARTSIAKLTPTELGNGVIISAENGVTLNLDQEVGKQYPVALALIPKLVGQEEFKALKYFQNVGRLTAKDDKAGDGIFTLTIGNKNIEVKVKYDKNTKKFAFASSQDEKELFDPKNGFAQELGDIMERDEKMNKVLDSWKKLLDEAPESYLIHLCKSTPEWFSKMTLANPLRGLSLKSFSGSVPKNYTMSLIEAQRELVISKLVYSLDNAKTLDDVSKSIDTIFAPALINLEQRRDNFSAKISQKTAEGHDLQYDDFRSGVFNDLTEIGIQSNDYKAWYRQFVDNTFAYFGVNDLTKGGSTKARDLVKVFSYYTAPVDDKSMDGAKPDLNISDTGEEAEKSKKYNLHADYVEYVVKQIELKKNEGFLKRDTIPGPGGIWGIEPFALWQNHPTPRTNEFIDRTPLLSSSKDFIEFDKYQKLDPAGRKNWTEPKIILPRHDVDLKLVAGSADRALFKTLMERDAHEDPNPSMTRLTGIEETFQSRMDEALRQLEKDYGDKIIDGSFKKLKEQFKLHYAYKLDEKDLNLVHYRFGMIDDVDSSLISPTILAIKVQGIEQSLTGTRTTTKSYQDQLINDTIYRIIQEDVLGENNFKTYFKTTTVWEDLLKIKENLVLRFS